MIVQKTFEKKAVETKRNRTINQSVILVNQLVSSGYFNGGRNRNIDNQVEQMANFLDGRILVLDSDYKILMDTYQINDGKYLVTENAIKAMSGVLSDSENNQVVDGYLECYIPVTNVETKETAGAMENAAVEDDAIENRPQGMLVVYATIKDTVTILDYVKEQGKTLIVLFGICCLLVSLFVVYLLTQYFHDLRKQIGAVAEQPEQKLLTAKGFTELKDLANAFNLSVAKMEKLEESRQEFVSNVSHELKTPITSIKVLADSLITQDNVPAEMYREFMEDIVEEIDRENKIINDLLSLVKLDRKSDNVLNVTTVNINDMLELLLRRLRPLAAKRNIEIVYESFRAVSAEIDEVKLTLALSNLVENAIKYNNDDGWIRVTLNADHKYFYVKVADSGVGIPEDCQDHVFERFYRVDKARSRETGGTGLGLAITHSAISMHHGTIKLHSKPGEGTTFTVRVPLMYSVSLAVSNAQAKAEEEKVSKSHKSGKKKHEHAEESKPAAKTVEVKDVAEVQGNLGEVLTKANHNLKQQEEVADERADNTTEKSGPIIKEATPLEDAEPEVVVLHTDEMENPEVVVLQTDEMENPDAVVLHTDEHEAVDERVENIEKTDSGSVDAGGAVDFNGHSSMDRENGYQDESNQEDAMPDDIQQAREELMNAMMAESAVFEAAMRADDDALEEALQGISDSKDSSSVIAQEGGDADE